MNFINLTNGIEKIPALDNWAAVRISSTTIEKKDWELLFQDLDHNLLFWLSQGEECRVYDYGTRRLTSKTVSVGIPLIKQILENVWLGKPTTTALAKIVQGRIERATTKKSQDVKRKLKYYRKILDTDEIRLTGHSETTDNDGKIDFYKKILKDDKNGRK